MSHCAWCHSTHHLGPCWKARLMNERLLDQFLRSHHRRCRGTGFHSRIALCCDTCTKPTRADLLSPRGWCPRCEGEFRQLFGRVAA